MDTHVVIMAGGVGSRLWPVSTPEKPKQFIDLLGIGKTMIQLTVERFLPVCRMENFWVVTSCKYVDTVKSQLPEIPHDHILAEPCPRNTAPCIAYACWKIASVNPEANVIVTPSDALVVNVQKFATILRRALNFSAENEEIVTVGISPSRPETGYGYIRMEEKKVGEVVKVKEFKEKPDEGTARKYLSDGSYVWNAGIFIWTVRTILSQMREYAPGISSIMDEISLSFGTGNEHSVLSSLFPLCEKISIDYAVMEKSDKINVIAEDVGWSDLGSYSSVRDHVPSSVDDPVPDPGSEKAEECGNTIIGRDVRLFDCEGCFVHAGGAGGTVVLQGLKDSIVAISAGNVLVCGLGEEQRIKEFTTEYPKAKKS